MMLTGFRFSLISIVFHWFVIIDSYIWKFFVLFLTHHTIYKIFTIKFIFGDQWEKVERTDPFHFPRKCENANGTVTFQISAKNECSEISLKVFQISKQFPLEGPIPFGFPSEKVIFLYKWKASLMIATYFNRTTSWNNLNWHNLCLFSIIFQLFYCFMQHGIKPESCLHANAEGVDEKCRGVQHAFFECKRSLVR